MIFGVILAVQERKDLSAHFPLNVSATTEPGSVGIALTSAELQFWFRGDSASFHRVSVMYRHYWHDRPSLWPSDAECCGKALRFAVVRSARYPVIWID